MSRAPSVHGSSLFGKDVFVAHRYADIAFTKPVKDVQEVMGSRNAYARRDIGPDTNDRLGSMEVDFIAARDGLYIASVSNAGWPYVQFRGGPPGFLRVLSDKELGFADFRGNRQYITTGNVACDDRVSLFLMDYKDRRRLKIFGRMRALQFRDNPDVAERLRVSGYPATTERAFLITVEAFDWNCPQHITPRYTEAEIAHIFAGVRLDGSEDCGTAFSAALKE